MGKADNGLEDEEMTREGAPLFFAIEGKDMTQNQRRLRELRDRQSHERQRMAELSRLESLDDETRAEYDKLESGTPDLERQLRAAERACQHDDKAAEQEAVETGPMSPELRERIELRSRCRVGRIMQWQMQRNASPDGPERELQEHLGLDFNEVPIELWDAPEHRADAPTVSPSAGVGQNLRPIFPKLLARSVANRVMGISMPTVGSGTYATLRLNAGLTASSKAMGAAIESTAATFVSKTTTPHRVSARLSIQLEDKALIGTESFQSRLLSQLSRDLAAKLDDLAINGDPDSVADDPQGVMDQLTNPTDPSAVAKFDDYLALFADAIDGGPMAETMMDVRVLANAEVVQKANKLFRDATNHKGDISAASYLKQHSGGLYGHSRMPATASHIAACIRMRLNAQAMGEGAVTYAECPVWQGIEMIADPYTDSAKATTHWTAHLLFGDILLIQPDAYERVELKVSS